MVLNIKRIANRFFKNENMVLCTAIIFTLTLVASIHMAPEVVLRNMNNVCSKCILFILLAISIYYKSYVFIVTFVLSMYIIYIYSSSYNGVKNYSNDSIFNQVKVLKEKYENANSTTQGNTAVGPPTAPPDMPDMPDMTQGPPIETPGMPDMTQGPPIETPGMSDMPDIPDMPSMTQGPPTETPGMSGMPDMPDMPNMTQGPPIETPGMPNMPEMIEPTTSASLKQKIDHSLHNIQNNAMPKHSKKNNNKSPVVGLGEYCVQGTLDNKKTPMPYDPNCIVSCGASN